MKTISVIFILFLNFYLLPQENFLHSQKNLRIFADHLLHNRDYLRAVEEYRKLENYKINDSILIRIAYSTVEMGHYEDADSAISLIPPMSPFYGLASFLNLRNSYARLDRTNDYFGERRKLPEINTDFPNASPDLQLSFSRLHFFWKLKASPHENLLRETGIFENEDRDTVSSFVNSALNPPLKSPLLAGILSSVVPGLGKIYVERPEEALIGFALTVASGYISYTSFKADHPVRGWIFGGLSSLFYLGNVYGTISATEQYNIRIKVGITDLIDSFVRDKNFFSPGSLENLLK